LQLAALAPRPLHLLKTIYNTKRNWDKRLTLPKQALKGRKKVVQHVSEKMRLEMVNEMQLEILYGGKILVNRVVVLKFRPIRGEG